LPRSPQAALVPAESAKTAAAARIFAGTSGWAYPTWKPAFYPETLPQKRFLEFYAKQLTSVEVNYTFRAFPTPTMIDNWLSAAPDYFRFSFKAPQRITHIKRLANCESDVAYFVSVLEAVRQAGKLGLLLFQLPPNMKADAARLKLFLELPALAAPGAPPIAFEFRHESWFTDEIYSIMRQHNAALCIAESDDLSTPEVHTAATHTSFRLRRNGAYSPAQIADFATRFAKLAATRDTYVYFKHEDEPTGALNATSFLAEIEKLVRS
jgi:uncharacterized protein YecE (DUF72 family)